MPPTHPPSEWCAARISSTGLLQIYARLLPCSARQMPPGRLSPCGSPDSRKRWRNCRLSCGWRMNWELRRFICSGWFIFPEGQGLARGESSLFEQSNEQELHLIGEAGELARRLGIKFNASGAAEPGTSLQRKDSQQPWSLCRRPWTLMYLTAHGRALPCCIAPFSMRGYDSFTLGDATRQTSS